jgi:methyl-accepting chemotaxis protein
MIADSVPSKEPRKPMLGIRGRLIAAFGCVTSLTIAASFVALFSYHLIDLSFEHIQEDGIPAITDALTLAREAAAFNANAADLPEAMSRAALDHSVAELAAKRRAMTARLGRLQGAGVDSKLLTALRESMRALNHSAEQLAHAVGNRLALGAERHRLMRQVVTENHKFVEALAPLFDDAGFDLLMSLQSKGTDAETDGQSQAFDQLAKTTAPELLALADLRAEINFDIGLLSEVALTPSADLLPPMLDRFAAGTARARKAAAGLPNGPRVDTLRSALDTIIALGTGKDGIFAVRERELAATAQSWQLVKANETSAAALTEHVEATVAAAHDTSSSAVASARDTVENSVELLFVLVGINLGGAVLIAVFYVDRQIIQRLVRLNRSMLSLAQGKLDVDVPHEGHDEISHMGVAVEVFKDNALRRHLLEAENAEATARKEERRLAIESYIAAFDRSGNELAKALATASIEMDATARAMSVSALDTSKEASLANNAAERATACADSAAHAAEEMSVCIGDISRRMVDSSKVSRRAVDEAKRADATMQRLAEAATRIGQVVNLIREVATQTNLLALNATIEAARVGEAGRGFAVVAGEVKNLATLTHRATEDIAGQIAAVQEATVEAVEAISRIETTIVDVNDIAATIAIALSQQAGTTNEIAEAVQTAADTTQQVNHSVQTMEAAATDTGSAAAQVLSAAAELGRHAEALRREIGHFLSQIRAA